jgi:hypothetical protein
VKIQRCIALLHTDNARCFLINLEVIGIDLFRLLAWSREEESPQGQRYANY